MIMFKKINLTTMQIGRFKITRYCRKRQTETPSTTGATDTNNTSDTEAVFLTGFDSSEPTATSISSQPKGDAVSSQAKSSSMALQPAALESHPVPATRASPPTPATSPSPPPLTTTPTGTPPTPSTTATSLTMPATPASPPHTLTSAEEKRWLMDLQDYMNESSQDDGLGGHMDNVGSISWSTDSYGHRNGGEPYGGGEYRPYGDGYNGRSHGGGGGRTGSHGRGGSDGGCSRFGDGGMPFDSMHRHPHEPQPPQQQHRSQSSHGRYRGADQNRFGSDHSSRPRQKNDSNQAFESGNDGRYQIGASLASTTSRPSNNDHQRHNQNQHQLQSQNYLQHHHHTSSFIHTNTEHYQRGHSYINQRFNHLNHSHQQQQNSPYHAEQRSQQQEPRYPVFYPHHDHPQLQDPQYLSHLPVRHHQVNLHQSQDHLKNHQQQPKISQHHLQQQQYSQQHHHSQQSVQYHQNHNQLPEGEHFDDCGFIGASPVGSPNPLLHEHIGNPAHNDKNHFHRANHQKAYTYVDHQLNLHLQAQQQHEQQYRPLGLEEIKALSTNPMLHTILQQPKTKTKQNLAIKRPEKRALEESNECKSTLITNKKKK